MTTALVTLQSSAIEQKKLKCTAYCQHSRCEIEDVNALRNLTFDLSIVSARDRVLLEHLVIMIEAKKFSAPHDLADIPERMVKDFKGRAKKFLRDAGGDRKTVDRHVNLSVRLADNLSQKFCFSIDMPSMDSARIILRELGQNGVRSVAELKTFLC